MIISKNTKQVFVFIKILCSANRILQGIQQTSKTDFLKRLSNLEEELQSLKDVAFNVVNEKLINQFEENLQSKIKIGSASKKSSSVSWTTVSGNTKKNQIKTKTNKLIVDVSLRYETVKSLSKASVDKSASLPKDTLSSSTSFLPQNIAKNSLMDIEEEIVYEESVTRDNIIKVSKLFVFIFYLGYVCIFPYFRLL